MKLAGQGMSNRALYRDNKELYQTGVTMCSHMRRINEIATAAAPTGCGIKKRLTWLRDRLAEIAKMTEPFKGFDPKGGAA